MAQLIYNNHTLRVVINTITYIASVADRYAEEGNKVNLAFNVHFLLNNLVFPDVPEEFEDCGDEEAMEIMEIDNVRLETAEAQARQAAGYARILKSLYPDEVSDNEIKVCEFFSIHCQNTLKMAPLPPFDTEIRSDRFRFHPGENEFGGESMN